MDYLTLSDDTKKTILFDSLRSYETEHFRLCMVNDHEPGADQRIATLVSNIEEVKEKLNELGVKDEEITPNMNPRTVVEGVQYRQADGSLGPLRPMPASVDEADEKAKEEAKPKTTRRRRSTAKKKTDDDSES